ncbi:MULTISPECIES: hypothetical protein [Candidatus Ichthyocystis]|uniref:Uncharacterized protein n=1 Tax=Candidatus Ichthyocystis hellenicum TaxID=1561003 RepID=A0A0S4M458_9BURK|nr:MULTISPECIES: hypothetical protein [Ichthyocystis]CUT16936.1 hypothetical protein Ark11_0076 [Candidatus Ichthyocystis hellenicum]
MDDILVERVRRVDFIPVSPMLPGIDDEDERGNRGGGNQGDGDDNGRSNAGNLSVEFYLYTHNQNKIAHEPSPDFVTNRKRFRRMVRRI